MPYTKNVISLEKRVPEMNREELDFVEQCLALDPNYRLSARQLLSHPYLSPKNSEILRKYMETVL